MKRLTPGRRAVQHWFSKWSNRSHITFIIKKINSIQFILTTAHPKLQGWHTPSALLISIIYMINSSPPGQDGCHFADDIFKCIFVNEKFLILIKISLKFVRKGAIDNNPALVQIMAWRRPSDKPLSEPMVVNLQKHICVNRPQWVALVSVTPEHLML